MPDQSETWSERFEREFESVARLLRRRPVLAFLFLGAIAFYGWHQFPKPKVEPPIATPTAASSPMVIPAVTLRNADKVVACTVKWGKSDTAALGRIVARAAQDAATGKFVAPYQPTLTTSSLPEADLRLLLAQSDTLAAALARHQSAADCVAP